ncbi:cysteine-rich receptor-like protein kinase 41 [Triticum dicoccoides]|uniref:cysteine-rich receptor-like protein kinase 41 n=1 Tax=Triticum dicoccoides TaxID=85692 RepID=UPI00189183C6|nr:cysteine-rich receptor-like protein kinase 41 [Triticum dicoccoides]
MGDETLLERILNGDEEPKDLPLALLQSITNDFSDDRKIGQGGFGAVYKGELQNGIIVAVKRIEVNQITIDDVSFRREFNSLMNTNYQNVVRFLGFCSNTHHTSRKEAGEINLVSVRERLLCFEYIRNGSLDKHITDELRGLEWEPRYAIISGICKGLCYLHEEFFLFIWILNRQIYYLMIIWFQKLLILGCQDQMKCRILRVNVLEHQDISLQNTRKMAKLHSSVTYTVWVS